MIVICTQQVVLRPSSLHFFSKPLMEKTMCRGSLKLQNYRASGVLYVQSQTGHYLHPPKLTVTLFPPPEKLAQAKEENLDMHQVLDQTLLELNNL